MHTPSTSSTASLTKDQRIAILERIQSWQIKGKIAVQTNRDSGSAFVEWSKNRQEYHFNLSGPLGASAMQLTGEPGHVILKMSDGKTYNATSPEQLLAKQWGWNLPLSYLSYWIRGLPVPHVPQQDAKLDADHRYMELTQQGWHVEFLHYTTGGSIDLPDKIWIRAPTLKAKIVIYQWGL
jgi:outer membrane lipoprotein LolB